MLTKNRNEEFRGNVVGGWVKKALPLTLMLWGGIIIVTKCLWSSFSG